MSQAPDEQSMQGAFDPHCVCVAMRRYVWCRWLRYTLTVVCALLATIFPAEVRPEGLSRDGFSSPKSVLGTLAATSDQQDLGGVQAYRDWKNGFENRVGLTFGLEEMAQYLGTDSDLTPSDAASNVFRLFGTWTASGRGTPYAGALVFKIENRSAFGSHLSPQALGPSLGYAGLFSSTFSDAGWLLTNLYWRQVFADGRGSFVIGQVDVTDYIDINNLANPWTAFTNLAFEQLPTVPAPSQGLGAALQWRLSDSWAILAGFADANADPADPVGSARTLFDTGETFKHFGIGWAPDWDNRYDQSVQLTFWQIDQRMQAGVPGGYGVSFLASGRQDAWRPFFRAGYAKDGGTLLDRSISVGTGYDARDGKDLAGVGVNWGRAPGNSRNQFTMEAFYRWDVTDFFQITPSVQLVTNPANDPTTENMVVLGLRVRAHF